MELKAYYATKRSGEKPLSEATLQQHHAIIQKALAAAEDDGLVARNQARLVKSKPRAKRDHGDVLENVWEAEEAKQLLRSPGGSRCKESVGGDELAHRRLRGFDQSRE